MLFREKTYAITWRNRMYFFLSVFIVFMYGCDNGNDDIWPVYGKTPAAYTPLTSFVILPVQNPDRLFHSYQPLAKYLNTKIKGLNLRIESSRDYAHFEEKVRAGSPGFILSNPLQTIEFMQKGYTVIAMAGPPEGFRGLIIARKDSYIKNPSELKGKAISYSSQTSLAACIMPQYFLYTHGIDIKRDTESRYVGSQQSSIMNVYLRQTTAGATWPPSWKAFQKEHPAEASELEVLWETPNLINNSVMARQDIPEKVRENAGNELMHLHESSEGQAILDGIETERFFEASDSDYNAVTVYISVFEKNLAAHC